MDLNHVHADLKEFLRLLNENKVEYVIIGGYAVNFYGYHRMTDDLDVFVAIHPDNARRLMATLEAFGFWSVAPGEKAFLKRRKIFRMGRKPTCIELMTTIDGVSFDECFEARQIADIGGVEVPFIGLEQLKQNKQASGRHKDLDDLEHLSS